MKKLLLYIRGVMGGRYFVHKKALKLIKLERGQSLLDVGCGSGEVLEFLHLKYGNNVSLTGVDSSPEQIWLAKEKEFTSEKDSDIKFKVATIEDLPFPDNYFDFAISIIMAHHLDREQKIKMVGEMKRILKPDGKLLISDIGRTKNLFGKIAARFSRNHYFTKENIEIIEQAIKANRLKIIRIERQFGFMEHFLIEKQNY